MNRRAFVTLLGGATLGLSGCAAPRGRTATATSPAAVPSDAAVGYTHVRASGNRLAAASGAVPDGDSVTVSLPGTPEWVVGAPDGDGTVWAVALRDGSVRAYRVTESAETVDDVRGGGGPPLLTVAGGTVRVRSTQGLTHPVPVEGGTAAVDGDGSVALPGGRVDVDALPDARLVADGERLYVFGRATTDYGHAVLGDGVESGGVAVVDPAAARVTAWLDPPAGTVFEGIAPVVAEWNGTTAVVTVASDGDAGARVVVHSPDGDVRAVGPPVGTGFRWRHAIAVAPFGPDGETELAAVRTPHIGGTVEFYRLAGSDLSIAARHVGYSSHRIGSRNLDMAAAGDFDGDGRVELLVPTDAMDALAGLRRTADGVVEAWRVPLGGRLTTNLGVAGGAVAAGWDNELRVWTGR